MEHLLAMLLCLLLVTSVVQGLEMSLELNTPGLSGRRSVCGVLTCEENIGSNTSQSIDPVSARVISSMSILSARASNGDIESKRLIGTLTKEKPKLIRVSDGLKVDGMLESERATMKLEMVKAEDCLAQYFCEVRTSDGQGNELVQTGRLKQSGVVADGANTAPVASLQQLATLQQQVALLGASLEGKLGTLFVKMEALDDKVSALDILLESKHNRLEDKIMSLKDDLESVKDHINDKIESRVVDKLCQLETKLPGTDSSAGDTGSRVWASVKEQLTELKTEQQKSFTFQTQVTVNSTIEIVSALQDHMAEISTWQQKYQMKYEQFTATLQNNLSISNGECLKVQTQISSLQNDVQTNFEIMKQVEHNYSSVQNLSSIISLTIANNLKPAMSEVLNPRVCRRDMNPVLSGSLYPYLVIRPSGESGLDVPYVCDTGTDSGGWIIIQRRTTGNVDFYRDWNAYKKGFGRLDDDFWLGNAHVHALTKTGTYELRVDLRFKGKFAFAHYETFSLDSEENDYTLGLGRYNGTATDMLAYHNGQPFSTFDRDRDGHPSNCAAGAAGAWWYKGCYHSNLNGKWKTSGSAAVQWVDFSKGESVSFSEMKIRRV